MSSLADHFSSRLASFLPKSMTVTVNEGEDVNISYTRKTDLPEDTVIFKNGMRTLREELHVTKYIDYYCSYSL